MSVVQFSYYFIHETGRLLDNLRNSAVRCDFDALIYNDTISGLPNTNPHIQWFAMVLT